MRTIKIVYILDTLGIGGTEQQFLALMTRLDHQRFRPHVLAFPCEGRLREDIQALHIPLTCVGFSGIAGRFHPKSVVQLSKLFRVLRGYLKQIQPDIVQSFLFWANVYGSIAAKLSRVPVIITGQRSSGTDQAMPLHYRWLHTVSHSCATSILTNSQYARQKYIQQTSPRIHRKIDVVYNGIALQRYTRPGSGKQIKDTLHIPPDAPVIGIIASLHPCKGHKDVVQAAALVLHQFPQTRFLLVGRDKGIYEILTALAEKLTITRSLTFTGERDDIPELLRVIDIVVSSSYIEGLSNAILEAMAAAKPIIATSVGGTPELVTHEQTGLLVAPGNPKALSEAMIRLLEHPEHRKRFGEAGRKRVEEQFSVERMVSRMEQLYTDFTTNPH